MLTVSSSTISSLNQQNGFQVVEQESSICDRKMVEQFHQLLGSNDSTIVIMANLPSGLELKASWNREIQQGSIILVGGNSYEGAL